VGDERRSGRRTLSSGALLLSQEEGRILFERVDRSLVRVDVEGVADARTGAGLVRELDRAELDPEAADLFLDAWDMRGGGVPLRAALCDWLTDRGTHVTLHLVVDRPVVSMGFAVAGLGARYASYPDRPSFRAVLRARQHGDRASGSSSEW